MKDIKAKSSSSSALSLSSSESPTLSSVTLTDFINQQPGKPAVRHDNLMAKIPKILGEIDALPLKGIYSDKYNREKTCYYLPKREACLVAMSYSYEIQAMVYDYMARLEKHVMESRPTLRPLLGFEKLSIDALIKSKLANFDTKRRLGISRRLYRDMRSFLGASSSKDVLMVESHNKLNELAEILTKGAEVYGKLLPAPVSRCKSEPPSKASANKTAPVAPAQQNLLPDVKFVTKRAKVQAANATSELPFGDDFNKDAAILKFIAELASTLHGIYSPSMVQRKVTKDSKGEYFISLSSVGKIAGEIGLKGNFGETLANPSNPKGKSVSFLQPLATGRVVQLFEYNKDAVIQILTEAVKQGLMRKV